MFLRQDLPCLILLLDVFVVHLQILNGVPGRLPVSLHVLLTELAAGSYDARYFGPLTLHLLSDALGESLRAQHRALAAMPTAAPGTAERPVEAVDTWQVIASLHEVVVLRALVQIDEAFAVRGRLATRQGWLVQSVGRVCRGYAVVVA